MIFKTGSKLDAGDFVSYAIDPRVLNKISFEVPFGWNKGDDILPRSNIAGNGGVCFYGNKCPSENRTSEISDFRISSLSGECLGSTEFAAVNFYGIGFESTKFDCIALDNCMNNLCLKGSDVKIKKCLIGNAVNGFAIDGSSLTVTLRLAVQCDTFMNEGFDGSLAITQGTWFDFTARQAGTALLLAEVVVADIDTFTLSSNGKATERDLILFNADEPLVDQDKPEEIGAE
jgi:hypothetical protein